MFHSFVRSQYHPNSKKETSTQEGHSSGFACRNNNKSASCFFFWAKEPLTWCRRCLSLGVFVCTKANWRYWLKPQGQVRDASMQRLPAEHITFRCETIRATTVVKCLGCQLEPQGNKHAEAQKRVFKASKPQARYSRLLWAPRSIGLSRLCQTLVRTFCCTQQKLMHGNREDLETLEK